MREEREEREERGGRKEKGQVDGVSVVRAGWVLWTDGDDEYPHSEGKGYYT